MLPSHARMRNSDDFRATVKGGARVGRGTLVIHARQSAVLGPVLVGFVVSKAVGNAVVRNRVKRRLRHLAKAELSTTPAGARLVVRALPRSATDPGMLATDLHSGWVAAVDRAARKVSAQ